MKIKYRTKWMAKVNYSILLFFYLGGLSLFWYFFYDSFKTDSRDILLGLQIGTTAFIQVLYVIQKRVNRAIVLLLFNVFIYYICFFLFITKVDLSGLLSSEKLDGHVEITSSLTKSISWITSYMNVNLLIISIAIHALILGFYIYDGLLNRFYISLLSDKKNKEWYFWHSTGNLFITIGVSYALFWTFRYASSNIMGDTFAWSHEDEKELLRLHLTKETVVRSLHNYTKLLNIMIYPIVSLLSTLLRASAIGDNFSIKNAGFKIVVVSLSTWEVNRDGLVIWIIALTYYTYSLIFIIIVLSKYFTETIEKQSTPLNYLFESEREIITLPDDYKSHYIWHKFLNYIKHDTKKGIRKITK